RSDLLGDQLAARQHLERDDDRDRQGSSAPEREEVASAPMARIAFFGAGYAGLVSGACLADLGHEVVIRDVSAERIEALEAGEVPFYEPGLAEVLERNRGRLSFTLSMEEALDGSEFLFV